MWVNLKIIMLGEKKLNKNGYILYGSIYITFSEIQTNLSDRKQIGGCLRMEMTGWWRGQKEGRISKQRKETWCFHTLGVVHTLGVTNIRNTLIVVIVLQVYTYNKT